MPPFATVLAASSIRSPPRGAAPARTTRSVAVPQGRRDRSNKPIPEPTAPPLLLRESSPRLWLARCLHALAAAAALALAVALALPPVAHASSVGGRSLPEAVAYPCEDVQRYYAGLEGLAGEELRTKLAAVVSPHAALSYKDVWDALKILDAADAECPEASSEVIEIYAQRSVPKLLAGKPDGWNREHLWPRSYGLTYGPSLTDVHNIRPADVNGAWRSSQVPDVHGSKLWIWPEERREMGLLSALLRWHELDPPSRLEQLRNDRVCSLYQHNRNPFVNHPEYANLIWRNPPTKSSTFIRKSEKAWVNEFHYENKGKDENEFVELVVHTSLDAKDLMLVLYNGANGRMYRSLNLADREAFRVTESSSGYTLYMVSTPLQNGPADGIALVYCRHRREAEVLEFLSYEGSLRAQDGPGKDIVSTDIMLKETNESSGQDSLGLTGRRIGDFAWRKMAGNGTPGELNAGQMF